jgi:hypothetical protein
MATNLVQVTLGSGAINDGDLELAIVGSSASSRGRGCGSDIGSDPLRSRIGNSREGSESEGGLHVERVNSAVNWMKLQSE